MNTPSDAQNGPQADEQHTTGPQDHPHTEKAATGNQCSPQCPAAIREAHLRARLTQIADNLQAWGIPNDIIRDLADERL